eukprot:NODE_1191_length_1531_cov_4.439946_g988_i0.p1 GENE.NODE_1191_length_1531_cov_4.439946_g988_i0~~NODE_1191_length_1531_cov_4.439946_g988_i0.p1  ORF type:complete len:369 (+),score=38.04 NODE_1191_length_1531_cov_4.439946_g988_i0:344-1450(+)
MEMDRVTEAFAARQWRDVIDLGQTLAVDVPASPCLAFVLVAAAASARQLDLAHELFTKYNNIITSPAGGPVGQDAALLLQCLLTAWTMLSRGSEDSHPAAPDSGPFSALNMPDPPCHVQNRPTRGHFDCELRCVPAPLELCKLLEGVRKRVPPAPVEEQVAAARAFLCLVDEENSQLALYGGFTPAEIIGDQIPLLTEAVNLLAGPPPSPPASVSVGPDRVDGLVDADIAPGASSGKGKEPAGSSDRCAPSVGKQCRDCGYQVKRMTVASLWGMAMAPAVCLCWLPCCLRARYKGEQDAFIQQSCSRLHELRRAQMKETMARRMAQHRSRQQSYALPGTSKSFPAAAAPQTGSFASVNAGKSPSSPAV